MNTNSRLQQVICAAAGLCLSTLPLSARAVGLVGSSVTGALFFTGNANNYFDPANGYVPTGYLNTSGTTVTVSSSAVEFGYADLLNTDTANFGAVQLTIGDQVASTAATASDTPFTMTFTDNALAGITIVQLTDSFPNGGVTASLSGDVLTVSWAGGPVTASADYTSTFTAAAVPEPATWSALCAGAAGLALALRRGRRASGSATL